MPFLNALPGAITQGIIWGIMAIGVYITFKILDVADLTVDGSFATGGAVLVVMVTSGQNLYLAMFCAFLAGCLAGLATGVLHTKFGIPAILAGILTQLSLYSVNLRIQSDMANVPLPYMNYKYPITLRNVNKTLLPVEVSKDNEVLT
ncbi:MAG: ABC transporter permease, partial [Clostridia bacterium]|nr:ABC transporter permease [Clostridia bacterium]